MLPCRADWGLPMHSTCNGTAAEARVWYIFCVCCLYHFNTFLFNFEAHCVHVWSRGVWNDSAYDYIIISRLPNSGPCTADKFESVVCAKHIIVGISFRREQNNNNINVGFRVPFRDVWWMHGHYNARLQLEWLNRENLLDFNRIPYISCRSCPTQDPMNPMQTTISIEIYNICIWIVDYCGLNRFDHAW